MFTFPVELDFALAVLGVHNPEALVAARAGLDLESVDTLHPANQGTSVSLMGSTSTKICLFFRKCKGYCFPASMASTVNRQGLTLGGSSPPPAFHTFATDMFLNRGATNFTLCAPASTGVPLVVREWPTNGSRVYTCAS